MAAEVDKYLINEKFNSDVNQIYIDGTLGGGGHAAIILSKLQISGGKLFAFDKDKSAIERAITNFKEEIFAPSPSLVLFNESFRGFSDVCDRMGVLANGILLDLGVSSKQLDTYENGISYRMDSPLDMRFDVSDCANNITAKDLLNTMSEEDLLVLFRNYGEEPRSRAIARRICEVRRVRPLATTFDLRHIIEEVTPKIHHFKALSRIFQALRIKVNNELEELSLTLQNVCKSLKVGGRVVIISYHSLEDRIVKQCFKEQSFVPKRNKYASAINHPSFAIANARPPQRATVPLPWRGGNATHCGVVCDDDTISTTNIVPNSENLSKKLKIITKNPIIPSEEEILRNPRARSAKMRVAEVVDG